jgi:TolB-like protein
MKLIRNIGNKKNHRRHSTTDNGQRTTDKKIGGYHCIRKPMSSNGRIMLILACICIVTFNFFTASAAAPKRIALLPFKINSDKDLSFLRDGIFDMLTTRLSKEGRVEVLGRAQVEEAIASAAPAGAINENSARSIGARLNADFVLFGSLTVLGNNVSIDTKMLDVSGSRPTMTFFDQSQDLGAVITKINLIAVEINEKVFGRTQAAATTAAPAAGAPAAAGAPQPEAKTDIHAHPEKVLKEDGFITHEKPAGPATQGILEGAAQETQGRFWKSASFRHLINGVTLGDVDGDGKVETVTIAPHTVIIFRYAKGAFGKIAEIEESSSRNLLGVDCADINENGYAEIFVTGLNADHSVVNSFVLEYDGKNFAKIIDNSRYYYRVADTSNRGKILLGQRPGTGKPSAGAIFEMKWQNPEYVPADPLNTPRKTNLMGLTVGDVLNDGQETIVAYKEDDRIQVIDGSGDTLWDDRERFGGSMLYASIPLDYRGQVENKWYYPLRLVVWYNKAKKESQVIAVQNFDAARMALDQFRYFTKAHIAGLTWDGVGLGPSWKTRDITGYIQDFTVGDFDNDGRDELVAALVIKEARVALISEAKSTVIAYELTSP